MSLPTGPGGIIDGTAEVQRDLLNGQARCDGGGVGHRTGEAVEFGDDECVAGTAGGNGLIQAGAVTGAPTESMVCVDPILGDAEAP